MYIRIHVGPPVLGSEKIVGLAGTWIPGGLCSASPSNESSLELCRYIAETERAHGWNVAWAHISDLSVNVSGDRTYET